MQFLRGIVLVEFLEKNLNEVGQMVDHRLTACQFKVGGNVGPTRLVCVLDHDKSRSQMLCLCLTQ